MTPLKRRPDDADSFNDYLDDLAMGEPAPRSTIDASLAESVSRVHGSGGDQPPPRLKSAIWEDLMSTGHVADPGTLSASIAVDRWTGSSRPGWLPARSPRSGSTHRMAWIAAAVAVVTLLGGLLYAAMQPGGSNPRNPESNFAFVGPEEATPRSWPEGTIFPPAEDCTVPVLRIGEITAVLSSSIEDWDRQNSQRDLPLTPANNVPGGFELPEGEPADPETAAAIEEVYYMWIACANAGSIRQQFWLYSNDGLARYLAPNGRPKLHMIGTLGVAPDPVTGNPNPLRPISEMRVLPDGRVALIYEPLGGTPDDDQYRSFLIFVEHNGTWYIDDQYCGVCG